MTPLLRLCLRRTAADRLASFEREQVELDRELSAAKAGATMAFGRHAGAAQSIKALERRRVEIAARLEAARAEAQLERVEELRHAALESARNIATYAERRITRVARIEQLLAQLRAAIDAVADIGGDLAAEFASFAAHKRLGRAAFAELLKPHVAAILDGAPMPSVSLADADARIVSVLTATAPEEIA